MLVKGQVHGGVAQGLGQALMENCVYDASSGQILTASFSDYAMPRAADCPDFHFEYREFPCATHPLGAKGCGEAGTVGALPAVMSAVADALGVVHFDMPATPQSVCTMSRSKPFRSAATWVRRIRSSAPRSKRLLPSARFTSSVTMPASPSVALSAQSVPVTGTGLSTSI